VFPRSFIKSMSQAEHTVDHSHEIIAYTFHNGQSLYKFINRDGC